MRIHLWLLPAVVCLVTACAGEARLNPGMTMSSRQQEYVDHWSVCSALDANISRAVIVEHTLYPYEFEGTSATLTEIGKRDVAILADYYKGHPGELTLVRGEAGEQLYRQRTEAVRAALKEAGADVSHVTLSDGRPTGGGVTSQEILAGYEADKQVGSQTKTETTVGGTTGGGSPGETR